MGTVIAIRSSDPTLWPQSQLKAVVTIVRRKQLLTRPLGGLTQNIHEGSYSAGSCSHNGLWPMCVLEGRFPEA